MTPKLIVRNVNCLVTQILTAILQNVFGLELSINANTPQRIVMMEKHAPQTLVIQKQDNVHTLTHARLPNVILMLIVLHGDKQINSLQNA
jgi:hypothetical protein